MFNAQQQLRSYGDGPQLKVSSDRLVKQEIEPGTPGFQGEEFIHYTAAAPVFLLDLRPYYINMTDPLCYFGILLFFWCIGCCQAHRGLPVGFLLLQYSVLFTVESLSLLYLLFIS